MQNVHFLAKAQEVPGYGQAIRFECQVCKAIVSEPDGHAIIAHHAEGMSIDSSRPYGNIIEQGPMNRRNPE